MIKTKIVIVDSNVNYLSSLKKYFEKEEDVVVINTFTNGIDAYKYVVQNYNEFDLLITDILLPGIDGITMIKNLREKGINKKTIIVSYYNDEKIIRDCVNINIEFFAMKPVNYDYLSNKIKELFSRRILINNTLGIDLEISEILHNLGIPSHIRGYLYIKDSIEMMVKSSRYKLITKEVYPVIAYKYHTTPSRVERAIRHAIEMSCVRGNLELMEELFGFSISSERSKPTNGEFIVTIAERIKIDSKIKS